MTVGSATAAASLRHAMSQAGRPGPAQWTNLDGRVTLRTLILIRWIAVIGQLATVATVQLVMGFPLPLGPVLAAIGASVLLNLVAMAQRGGRLRLADRDAALYLGYDMLQLTLLLYLTGGLANPFAILLLAPMTVAAAILSRYSVVLLTGLNLVCLTVLAMWHFPLPWPEPMPSVAPLYAFGIWLSLSVSAGFISGYVFRVAEEARRFANALSASQVALAREQRLSSLGALAAAAAHELGSPLGTIAVVAKELLHDMPPDSPYTEDVSLLQSQVMRCREILAELARKPEADGGDPFERLPLTALVEAAGAPHRLGHIQFTVERSDGSVGEEPIVRRSPEIIHGLGNFIQNAHQFADGRVTVAASWDARSATVVVMDDGPGYPAHLLSRIGEPYLSARSERSGHMGLGIFIAQTLLEKTGALVAFSNNRSGGARVVVRWDRGVLEPED
ncbi:ActS/PrrB/RegB family redox-sensitive histidine kinase [Azospirillum brasilense]|uniref:ActS/PrrB/RegB family redox-sensitive histidine kinase n=1 Tax=Azospirillum brasilense TaxID=192 RepID=UPI001EDBC164|nr:ActS/PrrB/RegB family redox-sensitive histidine kinase [Azospirillum brasilense]UKJ73588.1 ActS/PrrB/RegB family redox-sensitive histidine kinase [Azospirillum brasilense]